MAACASCLHLLIVASAAASTPCKMHAHRDFEDSVTSCSGQDKVDDTSLLQFATTRSHITFPKQTSREQVLERIVDDVAGALGLDDVKSPHPHSPHSGNLSSFLVPYDIRAGVDGMGVFLKEPVRKGQRVWRFTKDDNLVLVEEDVPILLRLLKQRDPKIAFWLSAWTYAWPQYCKEMIGKACMIFDFGDDRYMNDGAANVVSDSSGFEMVATSDLEVNTELIEDYSLDGVSDSNNPAWWNDFLDELQHFVDKMSQLERHQQLRKNHRSHRIRNGNAKASPTSLKRHHTG